jgi:hypothetical protein
MASSRSAAMRETMKEDSCGVRKEVLACSGNSTIRKDPRKPQRQVTRPSICGGCEVWAGKR